MASRSAKKTAYFERLSMLCENYDQVLIVHADNVGSRQMAEIRLALRGRAVILMGKNTLIKTVLRKMTESIPQLERLVPCVKENVGLVFCISDPSEVRKEILENRVPAPARQGVIAPSDVTIPGGATGLDPSQTSFFQALGIATKIVKGLIEIQGDVSLIKTGEKVSASQSALLQKLNIRPFSYGLKVRQIYQNGSAYDASVLDVTNEDIISKFKAGVTNVAALSRAIGMPNQTSVPHCITEAFRYCAAAAIEIDFSFPEIEDVKEALAAAAGGSGDAEEEE